MFPSKYFKSNFLETLRFSTSFLRYPLDFFFQPSTLAVPADWQWSQITPNRDLIWSPCFTDFQCARLDVPLDWLDPSDDSRVILAIIKLPAADLTDYKGPVFTNPGGPGGSGVYALKNRGRLLQKVVGTNHDIISFDPRGIGATTPLVDCWSSKLRRDVWSMQDVGVIDSHPGVLYDAYARSIALSRLCIAAIGQNETGKENEILSFVSTASVARDMLEIMNKGGREKLRYWGFSYGTVLGGTFAAMYPNKIDRMVNDGNVDYSEWSTNIHRNFLHDSDKIMAAFYHLCHKAGVSACAFYSSSPSLIKERLQTVLENLKKHPIIVSPLDEITGLPEIITYSSLQRLISASLYRPILLFPFLAQVLASLEAGDGLPFLDVASTFGMHSEFSCNCEASGVTPILEVEGNDDASIAIQCADGGEMIETAEEFEEYANYLMGQGKSAGAVNALFRMACAGWTSTAKWRFTGTFIGNTSHPILFIANKADNVTPLRSAIQDAAGFPNSSILIQNSFGHTSLSAPSVCTATYIRAYFQHGTLPATGTVCEADTEPFASINDNAHLWEEGEDEMRKTTWELMRSSDHEFRGRRRL